LPIKLISPHTNPGRDVRVIGEWAKNVISSCRHFRNNNKASKLSNQFSATGGRVGSIHPIQILHKGSHDSGNPTFVCRKRLSGKGRMREFWPSLYWL